ncbi:calcium/sodium antiporter [Hahella sp. CCB-MM4]|uniref:calcium/sodium antiporter n=1 Tax=Hahella sp. (strain CCB-MM4) TaxID=1926491 RepID=UPI000B9A1BB2|nr:calcium/sodium antiporter [Hahella sp. CCB-MM4]OZG75328.1 calcium/sodium antiporter [Hahella sp. CCB-MM4]
MLIAIAAVVVGLVILVWSADRFVDGAAATAKHLGMSSLLIGMVIVGFGTSAPEIVVSVLASSQGNPGLALGNALGSNITNIALILGVTAVISPIVVQSNIIRKELPLLIAISALTVLLLVDGEITRNDGIVLLVVFLAVMGWSIYTGMKGGDDILAGEMEQELSQEHMSLKLALFWLIFGLLLLVASSRLLVWGAVDIATSLGISDLIIGLTIVAIGTSLPELASSIAATRKGEHDLAIGNVIGSNMFNTLTVIGIAGVIHPLGVDTDVLYRDLPVMGVLTLLLLVFSHGFGKQGRISRKEGVALLLAYSGYTLWLVQSAMQQAIHHTV